MIKLYIILCFFFSFQTLFSFPNYSIQVLNTKTLNDTTISFEIYISANDSTLILTSYQCVLCIANKIPVDGFTFVNGSSDLISISPSAGIGFNNREGETKLTFASMPGQEIIKPNKTRIGKFIIHTRISQIDLLPEINWFFNDKISTILTGNNFENITDINNFSAQNKSQLPIINIIASSTDPSSLTSNLTDGQLCDSNNEEAFWKTNLIPAYLIFDLGGIKSVSQTKFSFYNWQNGRKYTYSLFISDDTTSWSEVVSNAISSSEEWTINSFTDIKARYIKLLITANSENEWATIWEAQVYGSLIENDNKKVKEKQVPNNYTLSQNYPNPFNPSTKINFTLLDAGKVNLEVYNILGEKISTLVNQEMTAGQHEVNFNASNLASGIYVYRININNNFVDTKKMILMK